ncbi:hypothetical protein [Winogradskyella sp.]|uniref:hypothetical protein n=1 Tax=Winogradskyella sp. TaxID=1883156 RepID=UPI003BA9E829
MLVLSKAGLQVPVIPLLEVVGNGAKFSPSQMGFTASNIGAVLGITTISKVVGGAHGLLSGVNV